MEIIGAVVGGLINCLCTSNSLNTPIVEGCTHMINPKKEIGKLRKKIAELIGRANDVNMRLDREEIEEGKLRTNDVNNWFNEVENVKFEMNAIEKKIKETKRCLGGLLPDCCSQSNLGHHISKLTREVALLTDRSSHFLDDPSALTLRKKGVKLPTTRLIGKTTAEKNMEIIWQFSMDYEVGKIGVYGMGGVGKTTIVKEINNRLLECHHFDKVIWVTVSKDTTVPNIQKDIAKTIGLTLSNEYNEVEMSGLLFQSLGRMKKFALILDDMWEVFPLHRIGIPEPATDSGSKIIITTRSLEVCRRMGCHKGKIVKVEPLSEEEAWELFVDKVDVDLTPEVIEIAKKVVDECACLPLAIITIGGSMRGNNDIIEWRLALKQLKESSYGIMNMEEDVFKCLKFSYDRLDNEILRSCFLYCALYPEDFEIDTNELIDCWIEEELIEERNRQDELDQGKVILNKLKHHCLLESGKYSRVVMHDLVREMALQITKSRFLVRAGKSLREVPNEEEWEECLERVSLMDNKITQLLATPRCPKLCTLFLNWNLGLYNIPHHFFIHMQQLRVLDLRNNNDIVMLPDSVSDLVNLRGLWLNGCTKLKRVPSVAKLLSLRVLELGNTGLKKLPRGMKRLVNLKCLDLGSINLRKTFPTKIIAKLSLLERFNLYGMMNELYEAGEEKRFLEELLSLKQLECLGIDFQCLSHFASYVGSPMFKGLKQFHLGTLHARTRTPTLYIHSLPREVRVSNMHDLTLNALFLPRNTESLEIAEFNSLTSLSDLWRRLNELGCLQLRHCSIMSCKELEYVLSSSSEEDDHAANVVLSCLEVVFVYGCPKFHNLSMKGIPTPTRTPLHCLRELYISNCHNLKDLFSSSRSLELLQNLERIDVQCCNGIEEIIIAEEGEEMGEGSSRNPITTTRGTNTINLPMLKLLKLCYLPNLKSICRGGVVCDTLHTVIVKHCGELKRLPQLSGQGQSPPPSLQKVEGNQQWWDSLEWDDNAFLKNLLQPLFRLPD